MKQLLILSGKGGTGKTTVAAALIRLFSARAYADCDIDAPNLHLTLHPSGEPEREPYSAMPKFTIDETVCVGCGLCYDACRFEAIHPNKRAFAIEPYLCEGCGVCGAVCPAGAISEQPFVAGELSLYADDAAVFSTAQLYAGGGTSGKLVTEVKNRLKKAAPEDATVAVLDGSPGIGCPVIASLSGVQLALIVAEPSVAGLSDMERIVKTAKSFATPLCACVNKADLNPEGTRRIETFCRAHEIPFLGTIPFDAEAVRAVNSGKTIADFDCPAGRAVREIFQKTAALLGSEA